MATLFMVCYEVSLFCADDCLWEPWQHDPCNCNNETKSLSRTVLRNATGGGSNCMGDSKKIQNCGCAVGQ